MDSGDVKASSIWDHRLRAMTIASFALVFLSAFEALAVTTAMPVVAADLDGAGLYSLAFAAPLAAAVIGMVVAGAVTDRRGPVTPLLGCIAIFVAGLIVAGTAGSMAVVVGARLLQGLGAGGVTVSLFVLIARVYPPLLHAKVFALFSAAWVLPAMVGPLLAGLITQYLGWRWVFLSVVILVVPATLALAPGLRGLGPAPTTGRAERTGLRFLCAFVAAAGVLGLDLSREIPDRVLTVVVAVAALAVVLASIRPLLPVGALRALPGLPGTIATKAFIGAAFFGTEVYLPYLLTSQHGFSTTTAGLVLTTGGVSWALGSWWQGRMSQTWSNSTCVRTGTSLLLAAVVSLLVVVLIGAPPLLVILGWVLAGAGMGLAYPRINVVVLAESAPDQQGFNSAALSIADSLGAAIALAITGVFAGFVLPPGLFAAILGLTSLLALSAALLARRTIPRARVTPAGAGPASPAPRRSRP